MKPQQCLEHSLMQLHPAKFRQDLVTRKRDLKQEVLGQVSGVYMICKFLIVPEDERSGGVHQSKPSLAKVWPNSLSFWSWLFHWFHFLYKLLQNLLTWWNYHIINMGVKGKKGSWRGQKCFLLLFKWTLESIPIGKSGASRSISIRAYLSSENLQC